MQKSLDPQPHERPSTYFVLDRPNDEELKRLIIQDRSLNLLMGGVLAEQPTPAAFKHVLDVGCGSGGWAIEAAHTYPDMSLVGIDISRQMIDYAREQATTQRVTDHVQFQVMDALQALDFPAASFDLVNMRLGATFLRTWEWPKLLNEMVRVASPGAVLRLTDGEPAIHSNSPALTHFTDLLQHAMFQSGHLFADESTGLSTHLAELLERAHCQHIQTKRYAPTCQMGTPEWQTFYDLMKRTFKTLRPFLQRWGSTPKEYDALCQQALSEMQQTDFQATWYCQVAWGYNPVPHEARPL